MGVASMKKGITASNGYAIGVAVIKKEKEYKIFEKKIENTQDELKRFEDAVEKAHNQINTLMEKAKAEMGEDKAAVFESHLMLLDDPEFTGAVVKSIKDSNINAEKALSDVIDMYSSIFESMEDEYMRERGADIKDVGSRLLLNLTGTYEDDNKVLPQNAVIVAKDLTPSDTADLDKSKVIAFLTDCGGKTSHSAIMARTLEIPAVVGMGDISKSLENGDNVIVDGFLGCVIINPDENTIKEYKEKITMYEKEKQELLSLVNAKVYNEGKHIEICGNIGKPEDVNKVIENGGDGIGLFRTEFLYMNSSKLPDENEQYEAYKKVLEKMGQKPVIIRTLDIGGDKKLPYLKMPEEMNPFLGYRAIRLCLDRKDIFKTQLRALLRASSFGNLKIMFPMISSVEQFLEAKEVLKECALELKKENIRCKEDIEVGIMIEIPAAAIIADELAKYADFFSIGTNDLVQYTLAVDRMNEKISYLYDAMHPAVLRLIKMSIEAAHKEGKKCGMCGEMAGDVTASKKLMELGLDEFSMSASSILKVKKILK